MEIERGSLLIDALLILAALLAKLVLAIDSITSTQFLKDPEVIISNGSIYKLGFFSLNNSTDKYLGILYNQVPVETFLWIANRNKPLQDSSGSLAISDDGNLVVLNGHKEVLWSSNISTNVSNSSAHLLDTGNLVLLDTNNGSVLWESFQDPSDTFYSKMKLSANRNTGEKVELMSWKSDSDPSIGSFSAGLNPMNEIPEIFIWKDGLSHSRSGPWNRQVFIGVPYMNYEMVDGITLVDDGEGYVYFSFSYDNQSFLSNFVLTPQGQIEQTYWENGMTNWSIQWKYPKIDCDFYGTCGPFGVCNSQVSPICSCLQGFEPKNSDEWNAGNWTSGCARKQPLQCLGGNGTEGEVGKQDGFLKLASVKVPDFAEWSHSTQDRCKDECLMNCSCIAFAYYSGIGCMLWNRSLIDIQKFSSGGADLYIRVAYSELGQTRNKKVFIIVGAIVGVIAAAIIAFASWELILKWRGRKGKFKKMPCSDGDYSSPTISTTQANIQELPLFKLQTLRAATNNFDIENKLGQGGFGLVFKGILPDGQQIAVKRLSRASGQGSEEFMTEVEVISKLQHRNLVKLLGCCVEGEEKMLVYEYQPNKSLDSFLFDVHKQEFLDWKTRFSIINGICRGLLYLHKDSRLRIIHRDLKASNILLDENLSPKISDFGMARIFKGTEDEANTRRVVGTYGYMSPEYAMEGLFSEKSDVYSFGVLLIEIISGRRSSSFYSEDQALNLPGYAWKSWNEGNVAGLIDPIISDPSFRIEVYRCIHVGLLCVQEFAQDRPSMPAIISMLGSEIVSLPTPKQPAFMERRIASIPEPHCSTQTGSSANDVTITMLQGR